MNRLADATSPYLLQHKDNPVHWWTWGPEAIAEAKRANKPILLSVGYAACHWCHVMAHESFEDEATAAVMNELFVCIKVDREERPDIDAIYMGALHRLGEQGGWPLTMFLDSATRPFFGGTYFPKDGRYGRPSFVSVMRQVARVYAEQPETVTHNADMLTGMLEQAAGGDSGEGRSASLDLAAVGNLLARMPNAMDPVNGGLNGAPKFPQWSFLALLWRGGIRYGHQGCKDAALLALERMSQGGIYDHLAGGLARYSVDELWLAPHFEKMLYDNAQYLELLTEAWRETRSPLFAQRASETVSWLLSEMTTEGGAFAASLDADSEGEEGKFYVWTASEISEVLNSTSPRQMDPSPFLGGINNPPGSTPIGGGSDFDLFAAVYDVAPRGNWEGHTILNRLRSGDLRDDQTEQRLADMRAKLLARRTSRIRPGLDDKVLADWNGLMIAALGRAGVVFGMPEWLDAARRAFAFVTASMAQGEPSQGRLVHAWRAGKASAAGMASDYANMIWASIRLYEATADGAYLEQAKSWAVAIDRHHWTEAGGYATSADDATDVLVRLRPASDDATPNANAVMLGNLAALAQLTENPRYLERADELRGAYGSDLASQPIGHCGFLAAAIDAQAPLHVTVSDHTARGSLKQAVLRLALPGAIETNGPAARGTEATPAGTAIVCSGPTCSAPIDDVGELRKALLAARSLAPTHPHA